MNEVATTEKALEILDFQTGEMIDAKDAPRVAKYLADLREMKSGPLDAAIKACEAALIDYAEAQGKKTLRMGGIAAEVYGGSSIEWDAELLQEGLREAGLPEDRLAEVVVETVTYKVVTQEAKRVAAANPAYAAAVAAARTDIPEPRRVRIKS
jgi:hypothetical protein